MGFWDLIFPCMKDSSFLTNLMALYSMIPIIIAFVILVLAIVKRRISYILILIYHVILFVLCELILKNLIRQARPIESCNLRYLASHCLTRLY